MDKNESYTIKPVMNGFNINHSYRNRNPQEGVNSWDYSNDDYIFYEWDQVLNWIKNNPMDFPPTKI